MCLGPWRRGAGHHRSRAVCSFFAWLEQHGIGGLVDIEPFHVAAYIKALKMSDAGNPAVKERAAARPTVKRHLVAIRMLFDWLIVGQILAINPAHAVRGPKHVVKRGKTPVLQVSEQLVRNILGLAQSGNGAIEVPRVPQDDCGDEEVQARGAVLLVLVGAVTDLAEAMDEDGPRQAVACFALVVWRRRSASSSQSRVKSVRSSRPSSRSAAARPFCRG